MIMIMSGGSSDSGVGGPISPSGPADDQPTIGSRVGAYRLVRLLGGRANGLVYEVEDLERGGVAAMRILPAGRAAAFGAVRRLFSDTRALSQLKNPHLAAVIDLIEAEQSGQTSAIVMELLQGRSLAHLIQAEKTFSIHRILSILSPVLDALSAIHQVRLVHGDLKPENIFLSKAADRDEQVKLLGFGMGRSVTVDRASEDCWGPDEDTSINTPVYLSPEQAFGKELDHRTDIYSFGVILYRLLCGRLPYEGRNLSELFAELEMDPPRPTPRQILADPIGRQLDGIVRRCLEKDPTRRWTTVDELKSAFDGVLSGQPVEELAAGTNGPSARSTMSRPWLIAAGVAAATLVASLCVYLLR
jgi:serine/threonine protein kinase